MKSPLERRFIARSEFKLLELEEIEKFESFIIVRKDKGRYILQKVFPLSVEAKGDIWYTIIDYYEVLKIENNSGYEVHIQNPVFQEADYELIKGVKNLEDLPSRISVTSRTASLHKEKYLQVSFIPLRRNPASGKVEMLAGFDLALIPSGRPLKSSPALVREYTDRSVLANGYWVKIKVTEDGIHRLSHEQLRNLGINDPANVRVYGNGGGMLSMMNSDPRHD
ncbi:hypothetical protein LCGC14_1898190, partial [marine sediment metagenome]